MLFGLLFVILASTPSIPIKKRVKQAAVTKIEVPVTEFLNCFTALIPREDQNKRTRLSITPKRNLVYDAADLLIASAETAKKRGRYHEFRMVGRKFAF